MAEADFNPQLVEHTYETWEGGVRRHKFYPAVGSTVAVVYIEASSDLAAINAKLAEIEALADNLAKRTWTPSAIPGKVPMVSVVVKAHKNATAQE